MTIAEINPKRDPEADRLNGLARQYVETGRDEEAIACLLKALSLAPHYAIAHLHLGEILLRRGEYTPGWAEFEWGSRLGIAGNLQIHAPQWNGMKLTHGNILLIGSQGYGDVIQFARYIPEVAARCQKVFVGCSPEMQALIRNVDGVTETFTQWSEAPPFAMYAPMTSLPRVLCTTLENIPAAVPYISAPVSKIEAWRIFLHERFSSQPARLKIGVVWAGRTDPPHDARRSMSLADMQPLLDGEKAHFISLQKAIPEPDRDRFQASGIVDLSSRLTDFSDTAALIANLDLVISVDTAVAHLAGALGKQTWVFLKNIADWRWAENCDDCAWYPTMRLFRQSMGRQWAQPVLEAAKALKEFKAA